MFSILVIDHDMPMYVAFKKLLSDEKEFTLLECVSSGKEALACCKEQQADLIFINIMLPDMTGYELGERLYKNHSESAIYLIKPFLQTLTKEEPRGGGLCGYIEKPLSQSKIADILSYYKKEHTGRLKQQLEYLVTILHSKDYNEMYNSMEKVIDSIYDTRKREDERLAQELKALGEGLFSTMDFYDLAKNKLEELFPLNEVLISDKKISQLWLNKVMDYIFQQNSINRYPLLEKVFDFINAHIKEDITLSTIVEECAISQGYLSRIFKKQFHTSVMDYLHMRKMVLAKGYFCFTEYSMAEIAFKLGYNESSYFSKVFKKYEHMTGKQYKNHIRHVG